MLPSPLKYVVLFELLKMKKTFVKALCFYSETKAARSLMLSAKPQVHTICQKHFCNIMVREIESRLQTAEALKRIVRIIWFSPSWSFVLHNAQCPFHERLLIKCNKFLTSAPSFLECKVGDAQLRCSAAATATDLYKLFSDRIARAALCVCARDGRSLSAAHMFPPFYSKPTRGNNNKLPAHTYTGREVSACWHVYKYIYCINVSRNERVCLKWKK